MTAPAPRHSHRQAALDAIDVLIPKIEALPASHARAQMLADARFAREEVMAVQELVKPRKARPAVAAVEV